MGTAGSIGFWEPLVAPFAEQHRVIAYDSRGSGNPNAAEKPITMARHGGRVHLAGSPYFARASPEPGVRTAGRAFASIVPATTHAPPGTQNGLLISSPGL